jgi:glycerol-3-phosphate acyltransferase PlsY
MWAELGLVLGAYLYGSLPFVWLTARRKGVNLREYGSGSISGSALYPTSGAAAVVVGGFGDFTKGIFPVAIGYYLLNLDLKVVCLAGILALMGQCWPIFLRFHGGRGGSVGLGMGITLIPKQTLIALIPYFAGLIWHGLITRGGKAQDQSKEAPSHIVPLGMLISFALLPLITWLWGGGKLISLAFVAIFLLMVIRRLTADLSRDLKARLTSEAVTTILLNRFLYDRSYRDRYR